MGINFAAASTAGLNNPGTEIITLVKDGSGSFINPPSYDKMRAYLRSGEVPMLFVTAEGGETGSLYQLDEYSETENKIRFSNSANAIEFCAGCEVPAVYDLSVPKPLTYDYMPDGYPKKTMGTVTVMEEQDVPFTDDKGNPPYSGSPANPFAIAEGQTYMVNWDGTEYKCVCSVGSEGGVSFLYIGNLLLGDENAGSSEPFLYTEAAGMFVTLDTSAYHTISVKTTAETVTPMAAEFLPSEINELIMNSSTTGSTKKFKITVDDSGTISATEVT